MSIRWKRAVDVRLLVDLTPNTGEELFYPIEQATLDDLREACKAMGLVVTSAAVNEERVRQARQALADVDIANGRANKAEERAEKAEARVAELETALRNAAHGIALDEAGPVVYALNARHDEQEAEWESEREELVRTRQETQDKLSEARKELGELRANLRACERWGTDVSNARVEEMGRTVDALRAERDALKAQAQPTEERATDEELRKVFAVAWGRAINSTEAPGMAVPEVTARHAGILAVAARVRAERCLVTRAVEMGIHITISRICSTEWLVVARGQERYCAPADVPATLERMLGGAK